MSNCSTLGFSKTGQVSCTPAPVFNQETVANAAPYNDLYPRGSAGNEVARNGNVTFYWLPVGFNVPSVQISPEGPDTNPTPVIPSNGSAGASVAYHQSGLAQIKWLVNDQNLGLAAGAPCALALGQLVAEVEIDAVGSCPQVTPPASAGLSFYVAYSTQYTVATCPHAGQRAQGGPEGADLARAKGHHPERERDILREGRLALAFGIGSTSRRRERARLEVHRFGASEGDLAGSDLRVSHDSVFDPRLIFGGALLSHQDSRPLKLLAERSAREGFELLPRQFRQGLLTIPLTPRRPIAIELILRIAGQAPSSFVVAITADPYQPIVLT
jgi:hypothetical protein